MAHGLIQEIEKIVEDACAADTNIFGYGIWTHHITQVAEQAKKLAPLFGADPEIVEIAALLHDYASVKDEVLYEEHHVHGPIEAEHILKRLDYPLDTIEAVKHAIAAHRASVQVQRRSPEAECLANADAMTHILNVPSLMHLAYVQHGMGIDEGAAWVKAKLERSWAKLQPEVQTLITETYDAALKTLSAS
ncbi:MAG TPA: HD domain-containing protein [Rhodothermales bacterium]|nr:HD domain-containing protein [Rhodothermales bacterium]